MEEKSAPKILALGTAWLALGTSLLIVLLGGLFYLREEGLKSKALTAQAEWNAQWAGRLLKASLTAQEVVAGAASGPGVYYARLLDERGGVLAEGGPVSPGRESGGAFRGKAVEFSVPLPGGRQLLMGFSPGKVWNLPQFTAFFTTLWALTLAVVVILGRKFLQSGLVHPWQELVEAAEAIATGDLSRRLAPGRTAESGRLALAFNALASTTAALVATLEEKLVAVKTGGEILETGLELVEEEAKQTSCLAENLLQDLRQEGAMLHKAAGAKAVEAGHQSEASALAMLFRELEGKALELAAAAARTEEVLKQAKGDTRRLTRLLNSQEALILQFAPPDREKGFGKTGETGAKEKCQEAG